MEDGDSGVTALESRRDLAQADAEAVDATLAASGDPHAFERLYHAHVPRIHSLARRMLGPEDADEATQDVFVRAWQKLPTFQGKSRFGTWLYRLAINVYLGRRSVVGRERARVHDDETILERIDTGFVAPDASLDFETAISRLPEGARRVFVLHDVEGFKHHEIAEMLGVTSGTSKAQLHRARMILRRYLDR